MNIILQRRFQSQNRSWVTVGVPQWFRCDPVAKRYHEFFELLDWSEVDRETAPHSQRGRLPHPESAYIKACMVMIVEKKAYVSELRRYLIDHPPLIWVLGFRVVPNADSPFGFDVAHSVPCERHLRRKLHQLDMQQLNALLRQTVQQAQTLYPDLGETVALDTKHIYAHVRENNPKAEVSERFDPQRQPRGDPDCRLGLKRRSNQADETGAKTGKSEWLWGYGTGVAVAQTPDKDALVLADYSQTFNENDVTYGLPLLERTRLNTGCIPRNIIADAAFDAWYIYQCSVEAGGTAAIALNARGKHVPQLDEHACPLCPCNHQPMQRFEQWIEDSHRLARFRCARCQRVTKMNIEPGHLLRLTLDRQSETFKALYRQRTSTERINSQATALGIERPNQRRMSAIARRNRLIYIVINLKALQRFHERNLKTRSPDKVA